MHMRTGTFAAAALVGLVLAFGMALGIRSAAAAAPSGECSPAEPPMGNARDALGGRNKDGGLSGQQRAIEELQRCITDEKDAAKKQLDELSKLLNNLQMAQPGMDDEADGGDDMMSALDELSDVIRQQQELRDRTFRQGQDQRRQRGQQRGQQARPGEQGDDQADQQPGDNLGQLRQSQQALRDRLEQLMEQLKNFGLGQNRDGQPEQDQLDQLGRAGKEMGQAEGALGDNDPNSAVDSQGRALDALRKGAQSLMQALRQQQQMGQGPGPGRAGRLGQSRADQDTDPLGRPLRGRDYDDSSVKVPPEIDVQRARRIIEELRKRFGDMGRPQEELDYIERLLKDY